jgi:Methuselah N-terminus
MACNISCCLLILTVMFGVNNAKKCDLLDSVPIVGESIYMPTGELISKNVTYTPDHLFHSTKTLRNGAVVSVERHLRGCLCQIVQCFRLCCPVGYVYEYGNCTVRKNYHVTMEVVDNNGNFENVDLVTHPDYKHRIASSKPCQEMYDLEPVLMPSDNFTLMKVSKTSIKTRSLHFS